MNFPKSAYGYEIKHVVETNSTNDDILSAIEGNQPEGLVIVADRQLKGRGRQGRVWVTTPNSSLAFSVLLKPTPAETAYVSRFSALAGLAVIEATARLTGKNAWLKWPNDVIINSKKIGGILAEALWDGQHLKGLVIGIGINLTPDSVPNLPDLIYPASSLESETGQLVDRVDLLTTILHQVNSLRPSLTSNSFIDRCNSCLAFKGKVVPIRIDTGEIKSFRLLNIDMDGALCVLDSSGASHRLYSAELSASPSSLPDSDSISS